MAALGFLRQSPMASLVATTARSMRSISVHNAHNPFVGQALTPGQSKLLAANRTSRLLMQHNPPQQQYLSLGRRRSSTAVAGSTKAKMSQNDSIAAAVDQSFKKGGDAVAWWLTGCATIVAGIVVVGGLTRLTRSGLSMVHWKPHGGLPPQGEDAWLAEFEKYKGYPEYQKSDKTMTVDEFKFIYYMEWGHRMLGRTVGVAFLIPAAIFAARGRLTGVLAKRCALLGLLGGAQGAIGWWMVKSGLSEDLLVNAQQPRVSPYRLTVHLTMAFSLFGGLVWTATDVFRVSRPHWTKLLLAGKKPSMAVTQLVRGLARHSHMATGFIGLTIIAGALVAGNDAGRAFNDWPMYAERWFPEGAFDLEPYFRNFTENSGLVQFNHRTLAYASLASVAALLTTAVRNRQLWAVLPISIRALVLAVGGVVTLQATLGVLTLQQYVPTHLGSLHQCNALLLWTVALGLTNISRVTKGNLNRHLLRQMRAAAKELQASKA